MGRFITWAAVFALILPSVATARIGEPAGAPGPTSAPGAAPALRAVKREPLTVQGLHFATGERVSITLHGADGNARTQTTATAGIDGSFTVRFDEPRSRCDTLVRAVGIRGNRAVLKLLPAPACLPA